MKRLFGTDGIRAVAGEYPLDPKSIYALGAALVNLLRREGLEPNILIGRDTRESGGWMEQALVQGIRDTQGHAVSAGVIPTSGVSYLTRKHALGSGIVISASHNPYQDNGIKIFCSKGIKISDAWESQLEESVIHNGHTLVPAARPIHPDPAFLAEYEEFLRNSFDTRCRPAGIRVVLDCAHGASSMAAPDILRRLGFDVTVLHAEPDGQNINHGCGSLHPQKLAKAVVEAGGDIGIAYDGDADRALWVDNQGRILNGDHTLFILSRFMRDAGRLKTRDIVATTMSNMGLETGLADLGLTLVRTKVGDKYVLETMMSIGANLGGERSGHTIFLDDCPTGDGILTSLKMLEAMAESGLPLSRLADDLKEFPQVLLNVPVVRKEDFSGIPEIAEVIDRVRSEIHGRGRLDVRYSGTEPVARVMVEGESLDAIQYYAHMIVDAFAKTLGR